MPRTQRRQGRERGRYVVTSGVLERAVDALDAIGGIGDSMAVAQATGTSRRIALAALDEAERLGCLTSARVRHGKVLRRVFRLA